MVRRPLRGSVWERPLLSRLSQGERMVWWRLLVPCARRWTLNQKSRARSTASRGSLLDFSENDDRGRIPMLPRRMKLGRRVAVVPARPGPGGQWMTMGDSPPSLTYFCVIGGHPRLSKSSSGASRHARRRRWRTRAPVGSAFGPPPTHPSLISLWMIGRRPKSGSISRSIASG